MKPCPECGKNLFDYAQRCDGCGIKLHTATSSRIKVIRLRCKYPSWTLQRIANEVGITKQRVQQILSNEKIVIYQDYAVHGDKYIYPPEYFDDYRCYFNEINLESYEQLGWVFSEIPSGTYITTSRPMTEEELIKNSSSTFRF